MKHLSEEQLVLHHYREAEDRKAIEDHLAACPACRGEYQVLQSVLAAVDTVEVPERGEDYAAAVWARVSPQLGRRAQERSESSGASSFRPYSWAAAGAVAALCVAAFLVGRFWPPRPQPPVAERIPEQVRERILLVAVGDHLDSSQRVLIELANAPQGRGKGTVDISEERERAQDLVEANRLYRQVVARAGDTGMASVLDDLERVLIDIAHSPSQVSSAELKELRRRIEAEGILFKVRVIDSQVQEREKTAASAAGGRS